MSRLCGCCVRDLPRSLYSEDEYSKGRGISCCIECSHGNHSCTLGAVMSNNQSDRACFKYRDLHWPFASGTFRRVAKGQYISGSRQGQRCVAKWFISGGVFSEKYFKLDIKAVDKALEIVEQFNQLHLVNKVIKVNKPGVWRFEDRSEGDWAGQWALCEPYIHNYQKWNSNSGWNDNVTSWGKAMQALSHFSYHISGGHYVLCDLQGGVDDNQVILSDPAILSPSREYGVTDLGLPGIMTFFDKHRCTRFCRLDWAKPAYQSSRLNPVSNTTMIRHVGLASYSRFSRPDEPSQAR